jgi:hypothetical protein
MRRMAPIETRKSGRLSSPAKGLDTPQTVRLLDRRNLHVQAHDRKNQAWAPAYPPRPAMPDPPASSQAASYWRSTTSHE